MHPTTPKADDARAAAARLSGARPPTAQQTREARLAIVRDLAGQGLTVPQIVAQLRADTGLGRSAAYAIVKQASA